MTEIPIVVIDTPGLSRSEPLIEKLKESAIFNLIILKATMGYELEKFTNRDETKEIARYGRLLTYNERACSISHVKARKIISESELGGIILEDDARIIDLDLLQSVSTRYLHKFRGKRRVLSLLSYSEFPTEASCEKKSVNPKFIPLLAESPLAVATVLTNLAAFNLVEAAQISSQVSDWPKNRCRFHILTKPLVKHGDGKTSSVIGNVNQRVESHSHGLKKPWSGRILFLKIRRKIDLLLIRVTQ